MKVLTVIAAMIAMTFAEPPLSKSYLPPPSGRSQGYPRGPHGGINAGVPEVIAARSLETHGLQHDVNSFARNNAQEHGAHARFDHDEDIHVSNAGNFGRNAVADDDSVSLEVDTSGFKSRVSYQESEERSGYDENAGNLRSGNHGNGFARGNHRARSNGY
ncbi:uncharacterized protein [Battus philenor]|uniref:uncharacterized protein n=1 Tax=Battus philenor TaxID=42288 RepID=UPI0035CFA09D